ncbi:uncharacterized protein FIESC28_00844 [Fusarium coffeatum]|uniref:NWD NACHT-NTPase N-terminal domain-containing protein n=1 Tax=Fusarium coffeatum TaxID=231269 RepID=A0A366SAI8_9HYPO|nr:uncharacterized protein FIESC28_00844 [Fusarium coffeatum]RBR26344.1 hypothetical protein FIESC28_00844 [Fusarium coffeatum]
MPLKSISKWRSSLTLDRRNRHALTSQGDLQPVVPSAGSQPPQSLGEGTMALDSHPNSAPITAPTNNSTLVATPLVTCKTTQTKFDDTINSLWQRAYQGLRETDRQLLEEYEELLSEELDSQTNDDSHDHNISISADPDGVNSVTVVDCRQKQLQVMAENSLQRLDQNRANYTIFGREFVLRDKIARTAEFIKDLKTFVDQAVKASPEASLAWAGVCTILPILTNPAAAEEANRHGFLYVTSRMRFYSELEPVLFPSNLTQVIGLRKEVEHSMVLLYQQILEFQLRSVIRFHKVWVKRLASDILSPGIWKAMLTKIRDLEGIIDKDLKRINDISTRSEVSELNDKSSRLLDVLDRYLSGPGKGMGEGSGSSFYNYGHGCQYNTTGGISYNNIGSGNQFPGARFSGSVYFR